MLGRGWPGFFMKCDGDWGKDGWEKGGWGKAAGRKATEGAERLGELGERGSWGNCVTGRAEQHEELLPANASRATRSLESLPRARDGC